jgi:hypothetical protein
VGARLMRARAREPRNEPGASRIGAREVEQAVEGVREGVDARAACAVVVGRVEWGARVSEG